MKTSFKRFAALVLAAVMVLGTMNLSAWADTPAGNRTLDSALVISGLKAGDVVRFYKVLEENMDAVEEGGWIYTSKFIAMSGSEFQTPVSTLIGKPAKNIPMSITAERAGYMARLVATENAEPKYVVTVTGTEAVVTPVESGLYMAIITAADPNTVYNPVFVGADYVRPNDHNGPNSSAYEIQTSVASYSNSAAAKKSTLTITKSADSDEESWADQQEFTHAIGDSVSFFVNTTIPGFGKVYVNPTFEISDSMSNLALDTTSIKVYDVTGGGKTPLTLGTDYQHKTGSPTVDGYSIEFTDAYLTNHATPVDIRLEYEAKVTTDAIDNLTIEQNKVKIRYSTNPTHSKDGIPTSPGDFQEKKDETNHYTFTIDASSLFGNMSQKGERGSELVKIGLDAAGNRINDIRTSSTLYPAQYQEGPLEGAKFRLYTDSACGADDEYIPKNKDGSPKYAKGSDDGLFSSGADGRFTLTGLDAGTYYLKEISAPAGFIKHQEPVEIDIVANIDHPNITEWFFNDVWYPTEAEAKAAAKTYSGLADGEELNKFYAEFIRQWTYETDVLSSYSITIDGQPQTLHVFKHEDYSSEIEWSEGESIEIPASIPNTQGVELPSTGGIGTTIFYAGGAMLVLLAGILLVSKRRIA